jgi:type II secretory pathway pseudopilin PulG
MKKKVKKLNENERNKISGITLIALVVTIIVLLILASITINLLFGDNGVITQAQEAKDSSRGKEIQEVIDTAVLENERVDYSGSTVKTKEDVISELQEDGRLTDEEAKALESANTIKIGSVTVDFSELDLTIDAAKVSQNATEYYGALVENYDVIYDNTEGASNDWRIFYSDGTYIYLIADDYISYDYAPASANYTLYHTSSSSYGVSFKDVYKDYIGSINIDDSLAQKWLSSYWKNNSTSTNTNIRVVAYMLDTRIWNKKFRNSEYADYVIGGPTIEMYCASYNETHPTNNVSCEAESNTIGYKVVINLRNYQEDYHGIYGRKAEDIFGMCIASPSGFGSDEITGFMSFR